MHPKDLALVWERWSRGESLLDIAAEFGVLVSTLHQELQGFLDAQARSKETWVGAA